MAHFILFGSTLAFLSSEQNGPHSVASSAWSISPLPAAFGQQLGLFERCATTAGRSSACGPTTEAPWDFSNRIRVAARSAATSTERKKIVKTQPAGRSSAHWIRVRVHWGLGPAAAQTSTLPSGWSHGDIGSPVVAGNATSSGSTFTVVGAGTDVGGRSDEFHFAYQPTSGDLDVRVQVATLQNVDPGAKAGLMIRESLTDDARHAFMYVSPWEWPWVPAANENGPCQQRNGGRGNVRARVAASRASRRRLQRIQFPDGRNVDAGWQRHDNHERQCLRRSRGHEPCCEQDCDSQLRERDPRIVFSAPSSFSLDSGRHRQPRAGRQCECKRRDLYGEGIRPRYLGHLRSIPVRVPADDG